MATKPETISAELVEPSPPLKPGWQTSEFLLTAIFTMSVVLLIAIGRMEVSDVVDLWPVAGAVTGYGGVRGLAKMRS